MRKRVLEIVLAALLCGEALAAVETTTVSGAVYTPDGVLVGGGTVTCTLSDAATADDAGDSVRVVASARATIDTSGVVSIALVPNDALTPDGTYYECRFLTTGSSASQRATWTEKWSVTTTPDPTEIGDVTRLEVAPGLTVGAYVQYDDEAPSGTCSATEAPVYVTATSEHCVCSSGTWSCTAGAAPDYGDLVLGGTSPQIDWQDEETLLMQSQGSMRLIANSDEDTGNAGIDLAAMEVLAYRADGHPSGWVSTAAGSGGSALLYVDGTLALRVLPAGTVKLNPTDSPGTCDASAKGSLYYDASLGELCDCNGTSWQQVDGGGGC